jgi:hypothetical protein
MNTANSAADSVDEFSSHPNWEWQGRNCPEFGNRLSRLGWLQVQVSFVTA